MKQDTAPQHHPNNLEIGGYDTEEQARAYYEHRLQNPQHKSETVKIYKSKAGIWCVAVNFTPYE
jgi:hypothetical protein